MPDRIRGITIEINGDTTKLSDSLKDVNKEISNCQKALKDVDKLLKLDPDNIDLLRQKQGYLKDEISATKKKLDEEKAALQKMKDANTTGEVSEQQKLLERDIVDTQIALQNLEKEYKDFGSVAKQSLKAAGDKMKAFGGKVSGVGGALTKGVTGPIVAIGTASVAAFNEVDKGLDVVAAKTGATGDELKGLEGIVKDIATEIPTDFETAGNAVGEVSTRFHVTGTELKKLSTTYVKFAQINNTDVVTAVDNSQKALAAFGLDASNAETLLNTITATSQSTGASVESLTAGLIQNGTAFQEMGLSAEQSVVAMGMMETSGANSETVMHGLRKALKDATTDGIPLNEALINLQNTILSDTDATAGLQAAYDLFGKSGDQIYAAVQNGTLDFAALAEQSVITGDTVNTTFENMLDPTDQATVAINAAKVAGSELGTTLLTVAAPVITQVTDLIKGLTEKFKSLSPEQQENIIKFAGIAAAIGPVLVIGGKLISGLGALVSAFNPVTAIIVAVIAAGAALIANWDKVKAVAQAFGTAIKTVFTSLGNTVKNIWSNLATATSNAWNRIKDAIQKPLDTAKNFVKNAIDKIKGIFNFNWSLPKLKLPHVSISGGFSLFPPSIPHFSIDWYKKAYENPVMFNQPTVLPTANGMKGFGDGNGGEIVIGMNKLQELVRGAGSSNEVTINIYEQPGEDASVLAEKVQEKFNLWMRQKEVTGFA